MVEKRPDVSLKILGERNSGTNFLRSFIEANFDTHVFPSEAQLKRWQRRYLHKFTQPKLRRSFREAMMDDNHYQAISENGGWKHAAATGPFLENFAKPKNCHVICLVRHPVSWLNSMHRNPFHALAPVPRDFSDFIRSPWVALPRDMLSNRFLENPIQLLTKKLDSYHWLASQYDRTYVLRYEDLVTDLQKTADKLSEFLPRKGETIEVLKESARSFGVGHSTFEDYATKAKQASFSVLCDDDRKHVEARFSSCSLRELYPK